MAKKALKKVAKKASAPVARVKAAKPASVTSAKKSGKSVAKPIAVARPELKPTKPVKDSKMIAAPAKPSTKPVLTKPALTKPTPTKAAAIKPTLTKAPASAKAPAPAKTPALVKTPVLAKAPAPAKSPVLAKVMAPKAVPAKGVKTSAIKAEGAAPVANGRKSSKPAPIEHPKNARIIMMPRAGAKPVTAKASTKSVNPPSVKPEPPVVKLPPAPVTSDSKMQKNRAGFSSKELEIFRDMLLAKRRELLGDMTSMEREALRSTSANLSNLPVHMADMGTDNYEQEFTLGLVEKDRQLLKEINVALAKIQDGSYGLCEGTAKPISKARLEAYPWARYSIEYARQKERPGFGAFRRPTTT